MNNNSFKIFVLCLLIILCFISCTERPRDNPLDPKANGNPDIVLSVLSFGNRVELFWNEIKLTNFSGFNIYRKADPDSAFSLIAKELMPSRTNFNDFNIIHNVTYSYNITILGEQSESAPSNSVSITPGPGYNWIVDKWGYQVFKTTYDAQYQLERYYTDWTPQDIAIDSERNTALITQPVGQRMDIINTIGVGLMATLTNNDFSSIEHPYLVDFEPNHHMFWVSDSGGSVYRISSSDYSIQLVDLDINKPDEIFIHHNEGIVYIVDDNSNNIYRYNINGNYINKFSEIGNYTFKKPKKIVFDSIDNQFWFIDISNDIDYLYTGFIDSSYISIVDSFEYVYDMHLSPIDQSAWISVFENGNYKILQLSKAGSRQLERKGYYKPYHITHNPYDGSVLVTDSGNSRVIHYNEDFDILGIFTNLNFPIRLEVE
jgi:hypothetical protein